MKKRIVKQIVVAALLTSSIFSFTSVSYGKETTIQQSIDAVKQEMKKAPLYYVDPAFKSVLEPSKELYPVLNNVKKHYKEVKQKIQSSNLSTKEKKEKIKELDALYEEKITKGVIPYIDAYNYAVTYLDPILEEMLDAHAAGDLEGVEQAYHKLSYQLGSRTSILYRFTGKAPRNLLLEKYKKPSDAKRDELRIPVTIYMKNNEVLRLWKEGKKEEARNVMDEVLTLVSKTSINGKTNYSNLLSKEVKDAEALFSTLPIPTPTPEVPNNPSVGGGDNEAPSESSAERKLRLAKSKAIAELTDYKEAVKDDYSEANWITISSLKTSWTSTINAATTPAAVAQALSDAKAAIDEVKSIEQEEAEYQNVLATARNLAIEELTNYKNVADYSSENWLLIQSAKTTGTNEITTATTPAAVAQALSDAKTAIDAVKTLVQEEAEYQNLLATARNLAFIELMNYKNEADYSAENWLLIQSAKTTGASEITTATTTIAVAQALTDAKTVIDAVKTLVQEEEDENINQAPTVANAITDQNAQVGAGNVIVDASSTFSDSDDLTLTAVSSDITKATVIVNGTNIVISPVAQGTANITVTASDGRGGTVTDSFTVTVAAASSVIVNTIDWTIDGVSFTVLNDKVSLTEAVATNKAIYRTLGNTVTRYPPNATEIYKEKLIGGSDYKVYIEFPDGVSGFDNGYLFRGPNDGVTVEVINENTLRFSVNTWDMSTKFSIESMKVIIEKASDPSIKYNIDIKVNTTINQQVVIIR
ncbi:Ig-like domain-containing protein [Psychrobacillus soli]|uniref:SbsC C-terminal domain-containing protein n=1 Tax=Psychrobacillus soli TaxID=1543965 RepID=A0A544SY59_9BACI|nr:hypothetical protein [Psychrobacillus soli]TQR10150.1 hypothetical protein FG383_15300 [Psychrobacillus soli]